MRRVSNTFFFLSLIIGLSSCGNQQDFRVAPATESFRQHVVYNNKVDLLWVVDNSRSMSSHQQNLASKFGAFIDVLKTKKIDFNIGITTMDMSAGGEKGRFVGSPKVITSALPNARSLFQQNVLVGESGSDVERGFEAMLNALSDSRLQNENAGFFRNDAFLAVVFVSNEEDHSAGSVNDYVNALDQVKPVAAGEQRLWMANFIGITAPNGTCFTRGEIADPGDRYMALAQASGGQIAEICAADLSPALSNVRARIVERLTEFHIDREPIVDSIRVFVNGQLIANDATNGWTYQAEGFTVRFHGDAVPAADAVVKIDYQPVTAN